MRTHLILVVVMLSLSSGGFADVRDTVSDPCLAGDAVAETDGWVVKKSDHICGISDPKKISNPAKVKYQECLDVTPPMKKLEDEGIDPDSPEGKALRAEAVRLVTKACEKVREEDGYCGIWKKIKHSDGRDVSDITATVKKQFD